MEAIGAGASVLQFLTVSLQSIKVIHEFLSGIKDAPEQARQLTAAVTNLQAVMQQLLSCPTLINMDQDGVNLKPLKNSLKRCRDDVLHYEANIKKMGAQSGSKGSISLWKKAKITLHEKRIQNILSVFRQHTAALTLQLSLMQTHKLGEISDSFMVQASSSDRTAALLEDHSEQFSEFKDDLTNILGSIQQQTIGESSNIKSMIEELRNELRNGRTHNGEAENHLNPEAAGRNRDFGHGAPDPSYLENVELSKSIGRLCQLVNVVEFADEDKLETIQDDIENILQFVIKQNEKDRATAVFNADSSYQSGNVIDRAAERDLIRLQTLFRSVPAIPINQSVKRILSRDDEAISTKETKLREYDTGNGKLTVHTYKRRRTLRSKDLGTSLPQHLHEFMATVAFIPQNTQEYAMVKTTIHQRQFPHYISLIPSLSINPILPKSSKVFQLVYDGEVDGLMELIATGKASFRDHDEFGTSLLHYATAQPKMCRLLLDNGLDPDELGLVDVYTKTPLQIHLNDEDSLEEELLPINECRKMLLHSGADPSLNFDINSGCSFSAALQTGIPEIVALYLELGAPFIHIEHIIGYGQTPLLYACHGWGYGCYIKLICYLLDKGADINATNNAGENCLYILLYYIRPPFSRNRAEQNRLCLKELIQRGANVHGVGKNGYSVSDIAYELHGSGSFGSYRGDLWDSVLAECGFDILEFREEHPREACYTEVYTRQDFEKLWEGKEAQCPYYNDI